MTIGDFSTTSSCYKYTILYMEITAGEGGGVPSSHKRKTFFFFKDFIYSRETEKGRDTGRGRSRLPAEEPDAGLDPRTPG